MNKKRKLCRVAVGLTILVAGILPAHADWVPATGGTYDYGLAANWAGAVSNNVFLSSNYLGSAQTITLASDGVWNPNAAVVTAHTNATTLLLKATGSDRNLTLGGGVTYKGVVGVGEKNNQLQFGTVNANEKINFTIPQTVTIQANSDACWYPQVIFNGALGGVGGLNKTGHGSLYLQNAASTFTGPLNVGAGQVVLAAASATLSTTNIVIGRQDALFKNSLPAHGVIGLLVLGNGYNYPPLGTTSGTYGANGNRIPDAATVDMRGGNLRLASNDGDNNSLTETISAMKLTRGMNGVTLSGPAWGTNIVTTLAVASLIRSPGTGFSALSGSYNLGNVAYPWGSFGTGTNLEVRVTFGTINGAAPSAAMINGIIPWAVHMTQVAGFYWVNYYHGDFLTYGSYGLTRVTNFVTDINSAGATDNVKITAANPTLSADRTVNSLTLYTTVAAAGQLDGTNTLTLASGAVNLCFAYNPHGGRLTIGPKLNFNGQEAIFFVHQGPFQLNGILSNTGGNGLTVNLLGNNNNGAASLWLNAANTYTGPTTVNGGLLRVWNTTIPAASPVVINEGGGIDMRQGNLTIASLAGMGYVWFQNENGSGNTTLTVGSDNTSTTFAGTILNNGPSASGIVGSVVKTGTGTWSLSGTNGYTGATTISGGGLVVDGALSACTNVVTVQTGAFLGGTGTVGRAVAVNSGGLLAAGLTNSVGTLNISSNLNLQAGAILDVQITDTTLYDRIAVGGAVNLNSNSGAGSTLRLSAARTFRSGQQFLIIDTQSTNALQGAFALGSGVSAGGNRFAISYTGGTGNDVVLTVLPKGTMISVW
jgi:autotransporter-associated beta strand protein